MISKQCKNCGVQFEAQGNKQKYCFSGAIKEGGELRETPNG